MYIYVLMAQRKEQYPGQYAPEALECMSECAYDDNGDWLHEKKAAADATDEFERTEILRLEVSGQAIMQALRPNAVAIPAVVRTE